jgi:integrase
VPHIYTESELANLLDATDSLRPRNALRPVTYRALFGLLASSGLRAGEALRLTRADVDLENGVLSVRESKGRQSRFVPLHPSTVRALRLYSKQRDRRLLKPVCDRFFVMDNGRPPKLRQLAWALRSLAKALHWKVRGDYPMHRVRDFRHTFIVRGIMQAFKERGDCDRVALALATYVGHAHVEQTYWYVTGIPELLAVVGRRFHRCAEVLP